MAMLNFVVGAVFGLVLFTFNVSAETYYIVPELTSCPSLNETMPIDDTRSLQEHNVENTTCLTLDEYARRLQIDADNNVSFTNITMIFAPGHHTLSSRLKIQNVTKLVLRATASDINSSTISVAMVTCTTQNSAGFNFLHISEVRVSGLAFSNCRENTVSSVDKLRINRCRFENGHGIELMNVRNVTLKRSAFISLTAFREVTMVSDSSSFLILQKNVKSGGAIIAIDSPMIIIECLFEQNSATGFGGAIWTLRGSVIVSHSNNFSDNSAGVNGGAVWTFLDPVDITDSNFSHNRAKKDGGVVWTLDGDVSASESVFISNEASSGGVISTTGGSVTICDSTFKRNTARTNGGAIKTVSGSISSYDSDFNSNKANASGGAIEASRGIIDIHGSAFTNNTADAGGAIQMDGGGININASSFANNTAFTDGGALLLNNIVSEVTNTINNTDFLHNHATNQGRVVYVKSGALNFHGSFEITNNSAKTGVVFALQSILFLSGDTIISDNKASFYAFDSNVTFSGSTTFTNNSHIHDIGVEEGGAVTAFQSEIVFAGTVEMMYNAMNDQSGGAMLLSESKIYTFGNTIIRDNTALSGAGIYAYQSELNFGGLTRIRNNVGVMNGGGIYAVGSTIRLTGRGSGLRFVENRAERGGGVFMELNAKLYVLKSLPECSKAQFNPICMQSNSSNLRLFFTNNSAEYGGALFISDDTTSGTCATSTDSSASSECFFQDLALYAQTFYDKPLIVQNTYFDGNLANVSGGTIFGGLFDRCTVSPYAQVFKKYQNNIALDAMSYLTSISSLEAKDFQSEISSEAVRVCFSTNNSPNCDHDPPEITVQKGETFSISVVAVDQVRNPISSSVRAYLSSNLGGFAQGEQIQNTSSSCTNLNFTITSPHDSEQLVLFAEGPCNDAGISQIRLNVTFRPCSCPVGFIRTAERSNCSCECDPCLFSEYTKGCFFENSSVQRKDNVWISYINETLEVLQDEYRSYRNECQYLKYRYCPFDYCHPSSSSIRINLNTPAGSDAQCAFNRTGILCGSCEDGLSLSLGSSRCISCSNNWLALLIVFAVAGVALVAFIILFNLTVAVGTINGLILYANILAINRATFLPFQSTNFFTIFIAWLNLDFGFVTCFFDGMDGYIKEWLQLAFPIYIIFLVTMVIIACEYSTRIAKLFTHTNSVATLATLILLSYAKSLRIIIAALSQATLEYPDGSRESVWLVDANIRYFKGKHIPLFLVALLILLVGIVYTSLLFSYQWLQRCSSRRVLKWIKNARFYPFMDAYLAPYNFKHRYWTGLLLFIRAFLYVVAALNVSADPGNNLLSINCTLLCLLLLKNLLPGKIYKSWPLEMLESSFIFNLLFFSVGSLYIREAGVGNQEALAYTSTTIAFITFLAILFYHTYAFMLPKKLKHKLDSFIIPIKLFSTKHKRNDDHEIIHVRKRVCTFSEVDGIPPQPGLCRVNIAHGDDDKLEREDAAAKLGISASSSSKPSTGGYLDSIDTHLRPRNVNIDENGVHIHDQSADQKQQTVNNFELKPTSLSHYADVRDSDELGQERENEIKDFIEVAR